MLKDLENNFSVLEKRILNVSKNYQNLNEKYLELSQEHETLKKKYDEERKKSQVLAEEQKHIKLYSAITGNPDHNRLMKNHINRLIKEVDHCIAELQNSGL
ncbi:V-type ATPase subunit a family protein [Kaistella faecalis]|uniref:V-type ATPase subunit a family protein n=1 Tax=Kaistella faecalis TaxID=2852098 RepID=UPI001C471BEE|nr:V-type ATPase subunit a family protein [Chryseobacterium faecale]UFK97307.1 V-type ATPase subunit a family protein [Chryseobacterium faecale]